MEVIIGTPRQKNSLIVWSERWEKESKIRRVKRNNGVLIKMFFLILELLAPAGNKKSLELSLY